MPDAQLIIAQWLAVRRRFGTLAGLLELCLQHGQLPALRRTLGHAGAKGAAALHTACSLLSPATPTAPSHDTSPRLQAMVDELDALERWRFVYRAQLVLGAPDAAGGAVLYDFALSICWADVRACRAVRAALSLVHPDTPQQLKFIFHIAVKMARVTRGRMPDLGPPSAARLNGDRQCSSHAL